MRRCLLLFTLIAVGCGGGTTPSSAPAPREAPQPSPVVAPKPQHDYSGWADYAPAEAAFAVRFPAAPTVKPASPATGNMHVIGVPARAGELQYLCQWQFKSEPYKSPQAEQVYLKAQMAGAAGATNGKLLEDKEISADGFPGRLFVIQTEGNEVLRCQSYVAGRRIITLQVWGDSAEAVRSPNAAKFFDSLSIGK